MTRSTIELKFYEKLFLITKSVPIAGAMSSVIINTGPKAGAGSVITMGSGGGPHNFSTSNGQSIESQSPVNGEGKPVLNQTSGKK